VRVRVVPRAKRPGLERRADGVLVARVTAPPVDGKANAAVCELIAKEYGVPKSRVSVVRGQTARDKVVRITGLGG
jgi:uncharacterized protein (TIGR00251 family)